MSGLYPQPTFTQPELPSRQITATTLPTTAPTNKFTDVPHGRVNANAVVGIEVSGACTLSIYILSPMSCNWVPAGSSPLEYQKTFTGAAIDCFGAPPNAPFFIRSDTGGITAYTDAAQY